MKMMILDRIRECLVRPSNYYPRTSDNTIILGLEMYKYETSSLLPERFST
jgi:hypothetical protein